MSIRASGLLKARDNLLIIILVLRFFFGLMQYAQVKVVILRHIQVNMDYSCHFK
jgi:hypothetical protein